MKLRVKWEYGGKVLDAGCGTGSLIVNILEKNKVYAVGLDILKAMIENAVKNILKHRRKQHVDLVLGDAHKLPFRNDSLDLIVSTGTLHHLRNLKEFFKEH